MKYELKQDSLIVCIAETKKDAYLLGVTVCSVDRAIIKMVDGDLISVTFSPKELLSSIVRLKMDQLS